MLEQSTTDVLIVGGGPTGLTLALELAAQESGIRFRIVDKALGRSDKSRAMVVQPRTLELLNRHRRLNNGGSIAHSLQSRGSTADGVTLVVSGRAVAGFETRDVAALSNTAFPLQLVVSQRETERVLDEGLAAATGGEGKVEWGVEARETVRDGEGVTVVLGKPSTRGSGGEAEGGEEEEEVEIVHAKFVVGCDGKNSHVREAAGLAYEGDSYAQDFTLADAHVKWNDPARRNHNRAYLCFGHGLLTIIPIGHGDMVRVVAVREPSTGQTDKGKSDQPTLEDFQRQFDREMPHELGGTLHSPAWLARFYLHHRGVDRYLEASSTPRLLVAGDAAHVHSPVGGQGMNTGIQDAVNLGWKLGAVLRGERPLLRGFLESYDAERAPVGRLLLKTTDRAFAWLTWMHPLFLWVRNLVLPWVLPFALRDPEKVRQSFWGMSQFAVGYRDTSGITGTAEGLDTGCTIRGGDRVLDGRIRASEEGEGEGGKYLLELTDAKTHHLLLFSGLGPEAASEGDMQRAGASFVENSRIPAKVHSVFAEKPNGQAGYVDVDGILHREFGFKKASYILVRPDGYAAHVGPLSTLDALVSWFNEPVPVE